MVSEDWRRLQDKGHEALTQAIGRMIHEAGIEAMLVPSAATRNGSGIVIFPDNLTKKSSLKIVNADELPT